MKVRIVDCTATIDVMMNEGEEVTFQEALRIAKDALREQRPNFNVDEWGIFDIRRRNKDCIRLLFEG